MTPIEVVSRRVRSVSLAAGSASGDRITEKEEQLSVVLEGVAMIGCDQPEPCGRLTDGGGHGLNHYSCPLLLDPQA
jgi:hypothetical protein